MLIFGRRKLDADGIAEVEEERRALELVSLGTEMLLALPAFVVLVIDLVEVKFSTLENPAKAKA